MIKLKVNASKMAPLLCKKIRIELGYKLWEFPCTQPYSKLEKETDSYSISVQGRTKYEIKLTTCSVSNDPLWIEVNGSEGGTQFNMLAETGFSEKKEYVMTFNTDYVGDIFKVKLKKNGMNELCIKKIQLGYAGLNK